MQSPVKLNSKPHDLSLRDDIITWTTGSVPLNNVIALIQSHENRKYVTLHYASRRPNHMWSVQEAEFECGDEQTASDWVDTVERKLAQCTKRPKKLVVFVNPSSGGGKPRKVYTNEVAPLFKLAAIHVDVIYTTCASHVNEVVETLDFSSIDGVVSAGGDGTVNLVANALMKRAYKDAGVDLNDPDCDVVRPPVRMGVIPAGSTNFICNAYLFGTSDPTTAAIHIILGDEIHLDTMAEYRDGIFTNFDTCLFGYGWQGDILYWTENWILRMLGPLRYPIVMFSTILLHRIFHARLKYRNDTSDTVDADGHVIRKGEWQTCGDEYFYVGAYNLGFHLKSRESETSEQVWSRLRAELSDGAMRVMLFKKSSRTELFPVFDDFAKVFHDGNHLAECDFPNVEIFNASELKVTVTDAGKYTGTCSDGELNSLDDNASLHIKLHRANLPVFARGLQEPLPS